MLRDNFGFNSSFKELSGGIRTDGFVPTIPNLKEDAKVIDIVNPGYFNGKLRQSGQDYRGAQQGGFIARALQPGYAYR